MGKSRRSDAWLPWVFGALALALFAGIGMFFFRRASESVARAAPEKKRQFQDRFPGLPEGTLPADAIEQVRTAANREDCPCGCGYTVASCLNNDPRCPMRKRNLDRVAAMTRESGGGAGRIK